MTNLTATDTAEGGPQPNAAWRQHKSGLLTDTTFTAEQTIRAAHSDLHLTRVSSKGCDLLEYAQAGFAQVTRCHDSSEFQFEATREFCPGKSRIGGGGGGEDCSCCPGGSGGQDDDNKATVEDHVDFGRWSYKWQGTTFLVYEVLWRDSFGNVFHHFFVLAPRFAENDVHQQQSLVKDDHHKHTDALVIACGEWSRELHDEIWVFDNARWVKSRSLWKSVQGSSWDDVILDPFMKTSLINDVQGFFDNRELYESLRIPWKRGVILHGSPGNGKTLSIKALMNSLAYHPDKAVQSLYVKSLDACNGPKWSIQEIFHKARRSAPCVLVFEDLDSLVEDETKSYFLNEVDGLESNNGILMIGSTNHLHRLDPAVTKRPSRFDRKYHYKLPAVAEREAYARHWREKVGGSAAVDFPEELCGVVAALTEGYSFAYMKELFITSLLLFARGGDDVVGDGDDDEDEDEGETATTTQHQQSDAASEEDKGASPTSSQAASDTVMVMLGVEKDRSSSSSSSSGSAAPPPPASTEMEDGGKKEKDNKDKSSAAKRKRTLPKVEIPEHLRDNQLVKIFRTQAGKLLAEMDHATEEEEAARRISGGSDDGLFPFGGRFPPPFGMRAGPKRRRC